MKDIVKFDDYNVQSFFKMFISKTVNELASEKFGLPFVKFVFRKEDIMSFADYFDLSNENNKEAISILFSNYNEYTNGDSSNTYILIKDYHRFFYLLYQIYKNIDTKKDNFTPNQILNSIWLRMNVSDFNDVNSFLEKQLNFIYNDDFFKGKEELMDYFKIYNLVYSTESNFDCFESNRNIKFSLIRNSYDDKSKRMEQYDFPVIHYSIDSEENNKICYIYGIQNIERLRKDASVGIYLVSDKRFLRNKYVSPEFIMSLKLFIELLNENGIDTIKVPLLQVLNYNYHEKLSDNVEERFSEYKPDQEKYEDMIRDGIQSLEVMDYIAEKKIYDRFYKKEDIISKNKYERLINALIVMQEKYDNIDFINDPFIEGDSLIIKIKSREKVNDNKRLCK